jgi:hypothetical protein
VSEQWEQNSNIVPVLELFDDQGKLIWTVSGQNEIGLYRLHELAQRIGNHVDEQVGELLSALDDLD